VRTRELDRHVLVLSFSLWLTHFAFMVSRDFPDGLYADPGSTLARLVTALAAGAISWALYLGLARAPPRASMGTFFRTLAWAIPTCALVTLVNEFAFSRFSANYRMHPELFPNRAEIVFTFSFFFWIFVAWAALYTTLLNAQRLREQERRIAAATQAASTAQLAALRLQIHPHFLFNTLNTLSGLIGLGRGADAERMILNLSAFLRHTLATAPDQLVALQTELEAQRIYLDIESVRFADRMNVVLAIEDGCAGARVPSLILQPLVENAVKYGLARSEGPVTVTIRAQRDGGKLCLSVSDEHGGERADAGAGLGIGLANVRERLSVLYGGQATLASTSNARGWTSKVTIPWMTAG
jgi:sensor histidine kinase YesM